MCWHFIMISEWLNSGIAGIKLTVSRRTVHSVFSIEPWCLLSCCCCCPFITTIKPNTAFVFWSWLSGDLVLSYKFYLDLLITLFLFKILFTHIVILYVNCVRLMVAFNCCEWWRKMIVSLHVLMTLLWND